MSKGNINSHQLSASRSTAIEAIKDIEALNFAILWSLIGLFLTLI